MIKLQGCYGARCPMGSLKFDHDPRRLKNVVLELLGWISFLELEILYEKSLARALRPSPKNWSRLQKHEGDADTVSLSFQGIHWPFIASFTLFTLLGKFLLQDKCCISDYSCIFWRSKLSWQNVMRRAAQDAQMVYCCILLLNSSDR